MAVVVGFDPSPLRLGWAAVDVDTGVCVALGCVDVSVRDGGWHDQQIAAAVGHVDRQIRAAGEDVTCWCREEPMTRFVSQAKRYGATDAYVDQAARRAWPYAMIVDPVGPTEWRRVLGYRPGAVGKREALDRASCYDPDCGQDAADALAVAEATRLQIIEAEEAT
jgi:hypothetical protein